MYINLASSNKKARAQQINADIGSGGNLLLFTGNSPPSPDYPPTGTLLVTLPLTSPAATASYMVQSVAINAAGSNGTNGAQLLTGTTGTGTKFQVSATISGGSLTAISQIVTAGTYSVAPTSLIAEPVTGAGLTGATVSLVLTGQLIFGAISQVNAVASGNAGYARVQTSGGVGIIDLDCGTSNAAVTMNTVAISIGGPVLCTADILVEA
jgi:hypothetical protein